jgi:hypothetical protein
MSKTETALRLLLIWLPPKQAVDFAHLLFDESILKKSLGFDPDYIADIIRIREILAEENKK